MSPSKLLTLVFAPIAIVAATAVLRATGTAVEPVAVAESSASLEAAERLRAEGSWARAHRMYAALLDTGLAETDRRWVEMRHADTLWRSALSTETHDPTHVDEARRALERIVGQVERVEDRDRVWAEAEESLGDCAWTRRQSTDWSRAWGHYALALDWWAGSDDLELARARYLGIVWKASRPPHVDPRYYVYGSWGNRIPVEILENAARVAETPGDRAHASYLVAMTRRHQGGDAALSRRVDEAFAEAVDHGAGTAWYDDALHHYAEWLARVGPATRGADGTWVPRPDFVRAAAIYRRLVAEFREGESRYRDDAVRRIDEITGPGVSVAVTDIFLPGSEVRVHLGWRNVAQVELALYPVKLTDDVRLSDDLGSGQWLETLDLTGREPVDRWSKETGDAGDHAPGQETVVLDDPPARGAYVLEATGAGARARELVLVTGASLVVKSSGTEALVFACDAISGAPRAGTSLTLWSRTYRNGDWTWQHRRAVTDADGIARLALPESDSNRDLFVASADGDDQAFSHGWSPHAAAAEDSWKIYAFTGRPAYRPGEQARWKVVARRHGRAGYSTPAGERIEYEIADPRGTKVDSGTLDLNRFGSAWSSLDLDESLPLGEFRISFWNDGRQRHIGHATLFRLEEYKLPEFRVAVSTPESDDGRPRTFRVGEKVLAEVSAVYYFGGPVADATVEAVVYQRPLFLGWHPPREFSWFYDDIDPRVRWRGHQGQIVHRATVRTDREGRAVVEFETPQGAGQDWEYTIEARVTDASRREIVGSGTVRASRQRYFVFARADHNLYRPGDEVRVDLKSVDANERPVPAEGRVTVTREHWVEVWLDPQGREVRGAALDKLRRRGSFPPPPTAGAPAWQPKFRGYETEKVLDLLVRTGDDGTAEIPFTPDRHGYYRVAWSSDEDRPFPVAAETTVWVADPDTVEIGYRHGGVGIIVDRDTFETGRRVPIMLTSPVRDAWVLFTVEADEVQTYRLVHMTGTVKLIEIDVDRSHVPNVFLDAVMVHDGELLMDSRQVIVPPVEQFLDVEIETDREVYRPRETGRITVTTRDREGRSVPAEVGIAVVDESVLYIQSDYAGDPRQFFYGTKRGKHVRTLSTFHHRRFADLARGDDDTLVGRKDVADRRSREFDHDVAFMEKRAMKAGAVAGNVAMDAAEALSEQEGRASMAQAPVPSEEAPGTGPAVVVRSDFRSTALWLPDVVTGEDGRATVEVAFPDSLTTWRAAARVAGAGSRFGYGVSTATTSKPLIVRLQAPRFFVVGDRTVVSAILNNHTDRDLDVKPAIEADGLELVDRPSASGAITVPARGETRIDWVVQVLDAGPVRILVRGTGTQHADAMERGFRAYEHGVAKFLSRSGKLRGERARIVLDLPAEREPGSTTVTVRVAPSLAVTMLDALPYLVDYPYGCTEQTMSRFLPAVITVGTLERLGLDAGDVASRILGGIETAHVDRTHPGGRNNLGELDRMVRRGLDRLYDFQHADGGWGWWKEGDSDPWMTAYVVWGLGLGIDGGVDVRRDVLERGARYLDVNLVEHEQAPDMQAWMLHALTSLRASTAAMARTEHHGTAFDNLWTDRDRLNAYTRALLALSAHHLGDTERADVLLRNLENGVQRDDSPDVSKITSTGSGGGDEVLGTAHWGASGIFRRWSDGGVEATAFALRALLAIRPGHELTEPTVNWLVRNRRGAQWSNTRDTAMVVLALGEYLDRSGELAADFEYDVFVNDHRLATGRVRASDALEAPGRFEVDPTWLRDGDNEIRFERRGEGSLYFAVEAEFFSLEEPVTAAGSEIFVRRRYYRRVPRPTLLKGFVYDRVLLRDGDRVVSGDRIEVVVTLEAKNDYEYLVFEDLKPAGLEAVRLRSGEPLYARELRSGALEIDPGGRDPSDLTSRSRWVYQELRDRKVALFVDKLPQGIWEIRYDLRAETPGRFHALPVLGHAMYVPEVRCNSAEQRLEVEDR